MVAPPPQTGHCPQPQGSTVFHQTTLDNAAQAARKLYTTRHTSAQKILAVYRTHGPQVEKARLAALEAEQSATAEGTTDADVQALHTEAKARYAECARPGF